MHSRGPWTSQGSRPNAAVALLYLELGGDSGVKCGGALLHQASAPTAGGHPGSGGGLQQEDHIGMTFTLSPNHRSAFILQASTNTDNETMETVESPHVWMDEHQNNPLTVPAAAVASGY